MARPLLGLSMLLAPLLRRHLLVLVAEAFPLPEVVHCGAELRVLRPLGGGAQGSTYLVETKEKEKKVLKVSRATTQASVARECHILQKLAQVPGLVRLRPF